MGGGRGGGHDPEYYASALQSNTAGPFQIRFVRACTAAQNPGKSAGGGTVRRACHVVYHGRYNTMLFLSYKWASSCTINNYCKFRAINDGIATFRPITLEGAHDLLHLYCAISIIKLQISHIEYNILPNFTTTIYNVTNALLSASPILRYLAPYPDSTICLDNSYINHATTAGCRELY